MATETEKKMAAATTKVETVSVLLEVSTRKKVSSKLTVTMIATHGPVMMMTVTAMMLPTKTVPKDRTAVVAAVVAETRTIHLPRGSSGQLSVNRYTRFLGFTRQYAGSSRIGGQ